jgi:hypothetical protein
MSGKTGPLLLIIETSRAACFDSTALGIQKKRVTSSQYTYARQFNPIEYFRMARSDVF